MALFTIDPTARITTLFPRFNTSQLPILRTSPEISSSNAIEDSFGYLILNGPVLLSIAVYNKSLNSFPSLGAVTIIPWIQRIYDISNAP